MRQMRNFKQLKKGLLTLTVSICISLICVFCMCGMVYAGVTDISDANFKTSVQEHRCGYTQANIIKTSEIEVRTGNSRSDYVKPHRLNAANIAPIADLDTEESRYCKTKLIEAGSQLVNVYDAIRDGINRQTNIIVIENLLGKDDEYTADEVEMVYYLVREDYPELFWVDGYGYNGYTYEGDGSGTQYVESMEPAYVFADINAARTAKTKLDKKIDSALSILRGYEDFNQYCDYDKELWVHDYIARTTEYDEEAAYRYTAYGALAEGKAVCEGYTRAFQLMLSELGIESCTITGSSDGKTIDHMWNAVKLDDEWYQVDLTWDDNGDYDSDISYSYFNITQEQMQKDHKLIGEGNFVDIPKCTATDWWYYTVNAERVVEINNLGMDLKTFGWTLAEYINDYGYARLYVSDNPERLSNLYMYESGSGYVLGELGEAVNAHMYIEGMYQYGTIAYGPEGCELILIMYPDDEEGEIVAADVWDKMRQDDAAEDAVIRAYPLGTSYDEIVSLIKLKTGKKVGTDYKCVAEAGITSLTREENSNIWTVVLVFEGIPLGTYEIAMYKPGCPVINYELTVEAGGISLERALQDGAWWFNRFGDVDSDWNVNTGDVLMMKRYVAGWGGAYDKIDKDTGDINGDGVVNIKDVIILEKHIAGWKGYEDLSSYWKVS